MGSENDEKVIAVLCKQLQQTIPKIRKIIKSSQWERLCEPSTEGELSPYEKIIGLYKTEIEMARPSMDQILNFDYPQLPSYNSAKRAKREGFAAHDPDGALNQWSNTRSATIAVIQSLNETDLQRKGETQSGTTTLVRLIENWALDEIRELEEIISALNKA